MDFAFREAIDEALHAESQSDDALRWAPIAIQQVWWRLSRYRWLKECIRSMIRSLRPSSITVSSDRDVEIVCAARVVASDAGLQCEVLSGPIDGTTNILYRMAPYGLPSRPDPWWLFALRWRVLGLFCRWRDLIEPYGNIGQLPRSMTVFRLSRSIGWFAALWKKAIQCFTAPRYDVVDLDATIDTHARRLIDPARWPSFTEDERIIINHVLTRYFRRYPPALLDAIAQRVQHVFAIMRPTRYVGASDSNDLNRLIYAAAKRCGVRSEYVPHGVVFEDAIGSVRSESPFQPDGVLAWNAASQRAFVRLGWNASTIRHPMFQRPPCPFRPPPNIQAQWKVLVFVSEWTYVSLANREDCAIADVIEIYEGLRQLGVLGTNIHCSIHYSPILQFHRAKHDGLQRLKDVSGMQFRIVPSGAYRLERFDPYDIVIVGATTGILETIMAGVPLVAFGSGVERFGVLEGVELPRARNRAELIDCLTSYDQAAVRPAYEEIVRSLQSGVPLAACT